MAKVVQALPLPKSNWHGCEELEDSDGLWHLLGCLHSKGILPCNGSGAPSPSILNAVPPTQRTTERTGLMLANIT